MGARWCAIYTQITWGVPVTVNCMRTSTTMSTGNCVNLSQPLCRRRARPPLIGKLSKTMTPLFLDSITDFLVTLDMIKREDGGQGQRILLSV